MSSVRVIYCAGEQGRVVLDILRADGDVNDVVFIDDNKELHGKSFDGVHVIGSLDELSETESAECIVAFGDSRGCRLQLASAVERLGLEFFSAVHPDTTISDDAWLGRGITVNAQTYVGPMADLGNHVLVDSCVNISHDVSLGKGVTVTPNASLAGGVSIERDAYIGPGATIIEDVTIGERAVVGAGAVVTDDVPGETTVVGTPAAPIND